MLPKIDVPIYTVKLLSNGEIVKFRPFTVKEEKLFLMANEADDSETIVDTVKQILNNCIISEIDVDKLPIYDFEYLFLNIRGRSVGESIKLQYRCNNDIPNENEEGTHKCDNLVKLDVNIMEIGFDKKEKPVGKIEITKDMGMVMKHPSFNISENIQREYDDIKNNKPKRSPLSKFPSLKKKIQSIGDESASQFIRKKNGDYIIHQIASDRVKKDAAYKVLTEFIEWCKSNHAENIWLTVRAENKRALQFYEKNGFVKEGDIHWQKKVNKKIAVVVNDRYLYSYSCR